MISIGRHVGAIYAAKAKQIAALGCAVGLTILAACHSGSNGPLPNQPMANTPVRLSPGDVIRLTFPGSMDLNQSQKIRVDGKVSLPLVGEVAASGKTVPEL